MRWVHEMGQLRWVQTLLDPKSSVEVLECSLEAQLTVMRWVYEMGQLRWVQ